MPPGAEPSTAPAVEDHPHVAVVPTRWNDNDLYGHVNNTVHYMAMDTVINQWMVEHAGLDIGGGDVIGLCVESQCRYVASLTYPDALVVGLRIGRLGRTSVTWETRMARQSDGELVAEGSFVHVFVDRGTRRPVPLPEPLRAAMTTLADVDGIRDRDA